MATLSLLRFAPLPPRLTRPSLSINLTLLRPTPSIKIRPRLPPISASNTNRIPPFSSSKTDRLLSVISYTYPLLNSVHFGSFLISRYPLLAFLASPFSPIVTAYRATRFADFATWLTLRFDVARNPCFSGYVRVNAMQAVMLDAVLTFAVILLEVLEAVGTQRSPVGVRVLKFGYGAVFVLGFVSFVYNVACCVVGRTPYLPLVSSVAKV